MTMRMRNAPNAVAHRMSTTDGLEKTTDSEDMSNNAKCHLINQMRLKVAQNNGIDFKVSECTTEGDCPEDCEKMALELEYLEGELERIQNEGLKINLKGVFSMDYEDLPERSKPLADIPVSRNPEKLEKLLKNPDLTNLPPRYLDSLLD